MKITAGLPFKHSFNLPDHSADDDWILSGKLSDTDGSYELADGLFSGSGVEWTLSIPSATTADYAAGDCTLYLIATKDSAEELVYESPAVIALLGSVSHARQMVTLLEAATKQLASKKFAELTTPGGESIKLDREAVEQQLAKYKRLLASESSIAATGGRVRKIQCGFKS